MVLQKIWPRSSVRTLDLIRPLTTEGAEEQETYATISETLADIKRRKAAQLGEARRARETPAYLAFHGSDANATKRFYRQLEKIGQLGAIAAPLMRVQKSSTRAKQYRGDYKGLAYDRKQASMEKLVTLLQADGCAIGYGWKQDPANSFAEWILYVDLPVGQVSFHALDRGDGPDYPGDWDRKHESENRIIAFCDAVFEGRYATLR